MLWMQPRKMLLLRTPRQKVHTTTPGTTTGGGVEDKVKAAEAAKATATGLEAQLNALKGAQAAAAPQAKGAFDGPITATQNALDAAKKDAAAKDAAAKSATTTPGTTTGGGESKLQFPTTEEKAKFDAAKKDVTDLKTQLEKAKETLAKNVEPPLPIAQQNALKQNIADLEGKLTTAQKKVDDLAKGAIKSTPVTGKPPQQQKKVFNDNNDRKIKFVDRTKVIYRDNDDDDIDKQYIISSNKNTCPTQSETVALNGKINPKGIRILADFDPCRISDGSVTLNMPNTGSIKLALLFIDNVGNNNAGVLVKPLKIQDLSTNQALFSVELDGNMNGINPLSGQSTSISRINGLALYNDGNEPIQFNSGNIAALTATFTK